MASNIPTRRTTRLTRTVQNSENAVTRPTRIATRTKPPSASGATKGAGLTRATAATAASRAKAGNASDVEGKPDPAAGKRKREALGEVTKLHNKAKSGNIPVAAPTKDAKGKGKEAPPSVKGDKFDGVVIQTKPPSTVGSRQPLRSVSSTTTNTRRTTRATAAPSQSRPLAHVKESKFEVLAEEDDGMALDKHTIKPAPTGHRKTVSRAVAHVEEKKVEVRRKAPSRTTVKHQVQEEIEEDRVFKKRRTSSDVPDDAKLFEEEEQLPELDVEDAVRLDIFADEDEADPNGDQWEDLDAEDVDDPLMVSEYVNEIFEYMKETELTTLPNPNYMESQKELAWSMRGILLDWLVQVHARFRLLPETFFLCVNIIDRFLSARVVSLAKLQLVGITCLFVAAKVEEIIAPSVSHFLHCADSSYSEAEILQAERYILKTIDWNLSFPNPMHYLRRISKADEYEVKARTIGKYLIEVGALEWRLLATPPSLVAAASMWLARLILGYDKWTPNLAHYSSYAESSLIPTANLMLNYVLKPIRHESFYKKYAGKRFMKVSVWVREWALEMWEEGTQVNLREDLPAIKAQNRARQEQEAAAEAELEVLREQVNGHNRVKSEKR
ncbi:hypothetical protein CONPUDRAFT_129457 [Coniophora puteana RWD-64-598 SS2]|uniref:Uncharacterized protein n=1 Tax=Coniophora puteana (strain RWD-64-598) TaxID=741705 RepID=A0A5M3ME81_CONPW|nr:uncharacterized protein CONPUDRAFT_129457 [Coniophora puteana RWD-64-598 SS2]EIW77210.1 hypothetical protein CONPUDRAFT_129457 [Coniophora puteana RWD-64-598 SS2]